jgi:hypothetical protein
MSRFPTFFELQNTNDKNISCGTLKSEKKKLENKNIFRDRERQIDRQRARDTKR